MKNLAIAILIMVILFSGSCALFVLVASTTDHEMGVYAIPALLIPVAGILALLILMR